MSEGLKVEVLVLPDRVRNIVKFPDGASGMVAKEDLEQAERMYNSGLPEQYILDWLYDRTRFGGEG